MKVHITSIARLQERSIKSPLKGRKTRKMVMKGLRDPFFPLTFLLRNLERVTKEGTWRKLPLRKRRAFLCNLLVERSSFFIDLKRWLIERQEGCCWITGGPASKSPSISCYCDHCGRCCEVASGFPDFSPGTEIPSEWQELFGNGLGKGHRFCAFLWEVNGLGRSLCAIHPWRSQPCRIFEQEECEYLKKDPGFPGPSGEKDLLKWYRLLCHLIYST